jgi:hypothetical protein
VHRLFRPLEEYVGPAILTMGARGFVFSGLIGKIVSAILPFVGCSVSTVVRILEFDYLN